MEEIAEQVIYLCDKHGKPEMVAELLLLLGLDECGCSTDEEYEPTELEKSVCVDIEIDDAAEEDMPEVIVDKEGFCSLA
tara:strand:+ start:5867 stop:6103 length:237 start_codon:yes stop_codon:yes gene_type:complete